MKDTRRIEEQVAELTDNEKENIIRINRYGILAMLAITFLSFVAMIFAVIVFLKTPRAYIYFDQFVISLIAIVVINLVLCIATYVFLRIKFPYYNDKRRSYIKRDRKKNRDNI